MSGLANLTDPSYRPLSPIFGNLSAGAVDRLLSRGHSNQRRRSEQSGGYSN